MKQLADHPLTLFMTHTLPIAKITPKLKQMIFLASRKRIKDQKWSWQTYSNYSLSFFKRLKGDLTHLLKFAILSKNEDIPRFVTIFEDSIESKTLTKYISTFNSTKNKIKKEVEEVKQAIQAKKENESLSKMIMEKYNNNNAGSFFEQLEKKYGGKDKKVQENEKKTKNQPKSSNKISK